MTSSSTEKKDAKGDNKKAKKKTGGGDGTADEQATAPYPDMKLCQKMHRLTTAAAKASVDPARLEDEVEVFREIAVELENPSLYRRLQTALYDGDAVMDTSGGRNTMAKLTSGDLKAMEDKQKKKMEDLEDAVEDAKENAGDMDVLQAKIELAREAAKSGSEQECLQRYKDVIEFPKLSSGKKLDALLESARVASFYSDTAACDSYLDQAHKIISDGNGEGGDWERRNRLKVYRALQMLLHRQFEDASTLFAEGIATFSCNEICTYSEFITYACLTNLLHLKSRPELKKQILDGPEVLSVAKEIPVVVRFNCHSAAQFNKSDLH